MSESYVEFNYRMATLLTSLGWRVNPVYDASNPLWADKDGQEAHHWRTQARRGRLSRHQAARTGFVDKHWKPGSGKHQGALVGYVNPLTTSLDGDRHPNDEGIIEHDGSPRFYTSSTRLAWTYRARSGQRRRGEARPRRKA